MKTEHFEMKDEEYIATMELLLTSIFIGKSDEEMYDMLSYFENKEDTLYAIALVSDIISEKYKDFLLDAMEPEGGIQ